jgi:hypothetical protein
MASRSGGVPERFTHPPSKDTLVQNGSQIDAEVPLLESKNVASAGIVVESAELLYNKSCK